MSKIIPSDDTTLPAGILGLSIKGAVEVLHDKLYAIQVFFTAIVPKEVEGLEHVETFDIGTNEDPGTLKDGVSDKTWLLTIGPFKGLCEAAGVKCVGKLEKVLAGLVEQDVVAHCPAPGHIASYEIPGAQEFMVTFENAPEPEPEPIKRRPGRPAAKPPIEQATPPATPPAPPRPPASTQVPRRFGAPKV